MKSRTRTTRSWALLLCATLFSMTTQATELQWFGQSAFKLTTNGGKVIVLDPFITKNPKTPDEHKDLAKLGKVDLILVTHGHGDHVGDTVALAEMTGAPVGMNADMGSAFVALGRLPRDQVIRFNKGNTINPVGDEVGVVMTHAEHSSTLSIKDAQGKPAVYAGGEPAGYIIKLKDGPTLYHAGDTGVFGDMKFIGDYYRPDVALLPIGGHFTMDPDHAAYATGMLDPDKVIPIHYGTFPPLKGTPEQYLQALGSTGVEVIIMTPGQSIKLE